jgi:hypothetical protein
VTCNGIVIYLLLRRDIISAFEEYDSLEDISQLSFV